jgi:hypothetical protein
VITKDKPDIVIDFNEILPEKLISDELDGVLSCGANVIINKRENDSWNAFEWTIPTLIVGYILKPYFETFLKEAGKEHYKILSEKIKSILRKGKQVESKLLTATKSTEKLSKTYNQSQSISIIVQTKKGRLIKLLFDKDLSLNDWEEALDELFDFVIENYEKPDNNRIKKLTAEFKRHPNFNYYAVINKTSKKIEFYDDNGLLLKERNEE